MIARHKQRLLFGGSFLLFSGLILLDYVHPRGDWYSIHPMTVTAIGSLVAFLAASFLLGAWLKNREIERLTPVSTVAYRSLAQYVNDAGRSLLAPITGIDIFSLGIPTVTKLEVQTYQLRLIGLGFPLHDPDTSGSWGTVRSRIDNRLPVLLDDADFVRDLYLFTTVNRRRLQDATAIWAPVMLSTRNYAEDLGRLRELSDAVELLQEQIRTSSIIGTNTVHWTPMPDWKQIVEMQFWACIDIYEKLRDEFADLAALPSDAIVKRKPASGSL